ncbi:DUF262 domain-containing protein [Prevotella sp. 10(H)]|uniref:DUF262 domain-containing protein n=1 Tax=Prevotella sp. 10(H) TaxID=1158294 RepID=UPI0004A72931|nr:DUF262 domain-containing protein [Prevotella sp. 10(H)]
MSSINLEPKLVGSIEGHFYVPAYQRGYRWKDEVAMLLKDIHEIAEGQNYCLQPIVVKNIAEKKFELIDGQQRLTTIFLIFRYMKQLKLPFQLNFSLEYQTRIKSKDFLENIDMGTLDAIPENIDEYFIIEAYRNIATWFKSQQDEALTAFNLYKKLNERIRIIWYEVNSDENAVSLFTRLNIGRIPLTNAELIKALFLSRNNGINDAKQLEIATEWDIIEKELHNDSLWYFITNEKSSNYSTRIELIFNLMSNKQKHEKEKLFTFFYFDKRIKDSENKSEIWTIILRYYQQLKEWYENIQLYHKIGYLIASESKTIEELILRSKDITKKEFQNSLDQLIAESIDFKKDYCDLSYDNKIDCGNIEKLLLLFNVETIRQKSDPTLRFPFDKHKQEDWSLEHIHAQQSQGLNKKEQWIEWLKLHAKSLLSIDQESNKSLIQKINNAIIDENLTGDKFSELFDEVTSILSEEGSVEYTHSLSNLALLGLSGNSALNNSTFDVKRNKILKMDKSNDYIPVCTRRVFLKYYTCSGSNQLHFWGKADRDGYIQEMDKILKDYLTRIKKEISL